MFPSTKISYRQRHALLLLLCLLLRFGFASVEDPSTSAALKDLSTSTTRHLHGIGLQSINPAIGFANVYTLTSDGLKPPKLTRIANATGSDLSTRLNNGWVGMTEPPPQDPFTYKLGGEHLPRSSSRQSRPAQTAQALIMGCGGLSVDDIAVGVLSRNYANHATEEAEEEIQLTNGSGGPGGDTFTLKGPALARTMNRGSGRGGGRHLAAAHRSAGPQAGRPRPGRHRSSRGGDAAEPRRAGRDPEGVRPEGAPAPGRRRAERRGFGVEEPAALKLPQILQMEAVVEAWLKYLPHRQLFTKHGSSLALDIAMVLLRLQTQFPNKKWYVLVHDDTYMRVPSLLCELAPNDPSKRWYVGSTHCEGANTRCRSRYLKYNEPGQPYSASKPAFGGWHNGGAGVVVSAAMAGHIAGLACIKHYMRQWMKGPSDVLFACCAADAGGQRVHVDGFTTGPPTFFECNCGASATGRDSRDVALGVPRACTLRDQDHRERPWKRLSYHRIEPTLMRQLAADDGLLQANSTRPLYTNLSVDSLPLYPEGMDDDITVRHRLSKIDVAALEDIVHGTDGAR